MAEEIIDWSEALDRGDLELARQLQVEADEIWHAKWGRRFGEWLSNRDSDDVRFVEHAIVYAGINYVQGALESVEKYLFEAFFVLSAEFRRRIIREIIMNALCPRYRQGTSASEEEQLKEIMRWWGEATRLRELFTYEDASREQVAEAERLWVEVAGKTELPPVRLRTGDLIEEERPLRQLSDAALLRIFLEARPPSDDVFCEIDRRWETDRSFPTMARLKCAAWKQARKSIAASQEGAA